MLSFGWHLSMRRGNHSQASRWVTASVLTLADEGGYVACDPTTGTTSQGETIDEAQGNLNEALGLYLQEFPLTKGQIAK